MALKIVLLLFTGLAILWRRSIDNRLPWTVLWVLTGVFMSRIYWLTPAGTLRAEQLACLVLFGHFLIDLLRRREGPRFGLLPLLLLAILPLMFLGSLLASPLPMASLRKTLIYFPYLAGFAALCHFLNSREKLVAAWDFLIRFGTAMVAVSLASYFLFLAGVDFGMVRVQAGIIWLRGSLVNPNIFGAAAGMVLILVLVRFLFSVKFPNRNSILDFVALIVVSAALVVSFSRAAWILVAMGIVAVFWFTRRDRKNWFPASAAILLSVLITISITIIGSKAYNAKLDLNSRKAQESIVDRKLETKGEFGEPALDRFNSSASSSLVPTATPFKQRLRYNASSARWRFTISIRALRDWVKSPIIGRGTDSMILSHPTIPQYYIPVTWVVILHDWGIVALALYIVFLLLTGFRLWKRRFLPASPPGLFLAVFLVFLFQTLQTQFGSTLQLSSFWVLAALFAVAAANNKPPDTPPKPFNEKSYDHPPVT